MKVLVVDDEINIRVSLKRILELEGLEADCAENGAAARELLENGSYDVALVDLKMPVMSGQELLEWIRAEGLRLPVLMISAHGEIADAVRALKSGARDFLEKPFDTAALIRTVRAAADEGRSSRAREAAARTAGRPTRLVGEHPRIREIRSLIERIAPTNSTVLITGESGTGKEVVAREIHERSSRSEEPFVAVNVGGLPEQLIESELFGYEKGAFTSADSRKIGLCELAGSGTLFLDEIGEMPAPLQVKLLRMLQDRKIRRLGGTRDIPMAARIVSATNRSLEAEVAAGRFREDLFYRLNVLRIDVPPLRERTSDLSALCAVLLERIGERVAGRKLELGADALERLSGHPFPGNIRELENVLERAAIYARGDRIVAADIDLRAAGAGPRAERPPALPPEAAGETSIRGAEQALIAAALERTGGNRTRAAAELGIGRRTLLYKLKRYGMG